MTSRIKQGGSSTTGLLSATAVFVGLLVYATYFAFDKTTGENVAVVESADHAADETTASIISPLSSGIFNSETLPVNELNAVVEVEHRTQPVDEEAVSAVDFNGAHQKSPDIGNEYDAQVNAITPHIQPVYPGLATADHMALWHRDQSQARVANQQNYQALVDGRGRGRGRGKLSSDGEFNFSVNLKSRARIDADSDAESRQSSNLNVHNNAYYHHRNTMNPAYQYYYQNY